jgi:hypothetical protein
MLPLWSDFRARLANAIEGQRFKGVATMPETLELKACCSAVT